MDLIKLKRQIRDWYNKHTNDEQTLKEVGKVIGFRRGIDHNAIYSSVPTVEPRQTGYHSQG